MWLAPRLLEQIPDKYWEANSIPWDEVKEHLYEQHPDLRPKHFDSILSRDKVRFTYTPEQLHKARIGQRLLPSVQLKSTAAA